MAIGAALRWNWKIVRAFGERSENDTGDGFAVGKRNGSERCDHANAAAERGQRGFGLGRRFRRNVKCVLSSIAARGA